ncbi:hypothetical protein [Rhizobium lusitanum]|nr:hypothetical protein [Rhizobium lusitanum]
MTECSEIVPASHGRAFTMRAGQFAVINRVARMPRDVSVDILDQLPSGGE